MKWKRFSREEFYDLVWTQRPSEISKVFYISEEGLVNKCKKFEIPLPTLKYWISFDKGEVSEKKVMGPCSEFFDVSLYYREDVEEEKRKVQEQKQRIQKEIENDKSINLKVPLKLTSPDPIITKIRDNIYKEKVWSGSNRLVYGGYGFLSIHVSPDNVSRALRFMDTLVKSLRQRGFVFDHKDSASLMVYGKKIPISFKEREKRESIIEKYGVSTILKPTGKLCFRLGESYWLKEWVEGSTPIEEQVLKFLIEIEYHGWKDREERVEREKEREIQRQKQLTEKELQDKKEKELKDFKEILKLSLRHDKAETIRKFADELEKSAISRNDLSKEIEDRIKWIRKKADWYDPFIEASDDLLEGIDRDELVLYKQSFYLLKE
jgi:hypothetical protein